MQKDWGTATVSVALAGVPPASRTLAGGSPFSGLPQGADVFGQRPKTAIETIALPEIYCMNTLSGEWINFNSEERVGHEVKSLATLDRLRFSVFKEQRRQV